MRLVHGQTEEVPDVKVAGEDDLVTVEGVINFETEQGLT
jgi:hypothetical protein